MTGDDDDIPVLTDAIERTTPAAAGVSAEELERLEARLCSSSLQLAEQMLRDACREAQHVMIERVMSELRAELPRIVSRALRDHFDR
jgi:hypothetical protein